MAKKEEIQVPGCCQGCVKWEKFKDSCWVYWEAKKECTQHTTDWSEGLQ